MNKFLNTEEALVQENGNTNGLVAKGSTRRDLLTQDEAADYLRISKITLWRKQKNGEIPYFKNSGRVLYRMRDLEKYIQDNMIGLSSSKRCNHE